MEFSKCAYNVFNSLPDDKKRILKEIFESCNDIEDIRDYMSDQCMKYPQSSELWFEIARRQMRRIDKRRGIFANHLGVIMSVCGNTITGVQSLRYDMLSCKYVGKFNALLILEDGHRCAASIIDANTLEFIERV